ncbi:hypothetical protein ACFOY2_50560 [Nonomuraea purpurea]|uniref:Uncharacterized protein n=1 Tax=Nonomuraea purpurea TaxID=1849276 RepID=A0ABV8GPC5_9ACTN
MPGPKALPMLGNLTEVLTASAKTDIDFAEEYHRRYGDIFALSSAIWRSAFPTARTIGPATTSRSFPRTTPAWSPG